MRFGRRGFAWVQVGFCHHCCAGGRNEEAKYVALRVKDGAPPVSRPRGMWLICPPYSALEGTLLLFWASTAGSSNEKSDLQGLEPPTGQPHRQARLCGLCFKAIHHPRWAGSQTGPLKRSQLQNTRGQAPLLRCRTLHSQTWHRWLCKQACRKSVSRSSQNSCYLRCVKMGQGTECASTSCGHALDHRPKFAPGRRVFGAGCDVQNGRTGLVSAIENRRSPCSAGHSG